MAEVIFRGLRMQAYDEDGEPAEELIFHSVRLEAEAMLGPVGEDGMADIEGFWLRVTEATPDGEAMENAPRIRFPVLPETMRVFASGMLDYLDKARKPGEQTVHVAGVGELAHLNRATRRSKSRRS